MTQNAFFEHLWDYFGNILSSDWVFLYFMRNLKNAYHINETQNTSVTDQILDATLSNTLIVAISWKYEFIKIFHLLYEITLFCGSLSILWVPLWNCVSFGYPLGDSSDPLYITFLWCNWLTVYNMSFNSKLVTVLCLAQS